LRYDVSWKDASLYGRDAMSKSVYKNKMSAVNLVIDKFTFYVDFKHVI